MKKPWLLLTAAEKEGKVGPAERPGLLASAFTSAMQKNEELRKEIRALHKLLELADVKPSVIKDFVKGYKDVAI